MSNFNQAVLVTQGKWDHGTIATWNTIPNLHFEHFITLHLKHYQATGAS